MKQGKCDLCSDFAELIEGHIWPKFAYKRFMSNLAQGGSFYDLQANRSTNRQMTQPFFCKKCDNEVLGGLERYTARWYDRFVGHVDSIDYDERLFGFAVSLSWRVAEYYMP